VRAAADKFEFFRAQLRVVALHFDVFLWVPIADEAMRTTLKPSEPISESLLTIEVHAVDE